jgi:hypothetical protein
MSLCKKKCIDKAVFLLYIMAVMEKSWINQFKFSSKIRESQGGDADTYQRKRIAAGRVFFPDFPVQIVLKKSNQPSPLSTLGGAHEKAQSRFCLVSDCRILRFRQCSGDVGYGSNGRSGHGLP